MRSAVAAAGGLAVIAAALVARAEPPAGAAGCTGCHATSTQVQTPVPRLAGRDQTATVKALQDFRSGARPATVMDRIAKGFTDAEIQAIAAWFAGQK
jgi:cytochrome c553